MGVVFISHKCHGLYIKTEVHIWVTIMSAFTKTVKTVKIKL